MSKINTAPVGGTRDLLPQDVLRRKFVVEVIERVYQSYGFEPLETPTLERLETLLGKYGEEGDQLIFRVMKRGEKLARALQENPQENNLADSGMRYDLTVPLARVVAEYHHRLPRIFKRYQIQPVFRADRPARGRYREFYQCDVDIVGSESPSVEAEVISAVAEVLRQFGFRDSGSFQVRLNHRGILRGIMEAAGVPPELESGGLVAIDKLDKIGLQGVGQELQERNFPDSSVAKLINLMQQSPNEVASSLLWLKRVLQNSTGCRAVEELSRVVELAQVGPAANHLRIDPFLARGLNYYTGAIFEIEIPGAAGSAGGGGRYDNLIGMFGPDRIPACGFSLGLERILSLMEERNLFPERLAGQPEILVTQFDEQTVFLSLKLAGQLRAEGFRVDFYPHPDKYGKQFKYAQQRNIRFVLLLSPRELESQLVAVKDLESGTQEDVSQQKLADRLRNLLRASPSE